jgi:hypothetical protein
MKTILFLLSLLISLSLRAADPLRPNPRLTPGATTNVDVEILLQPGYTKKVRHVPAATKKQVFIAYFGRVPAHPGHYEIDHLISLELGGSNDIKNLWPEGYFTAPFDAKMKDKLEDKMHLLVKADLKAHGKASATRLLKKFQHEIATDWVAAYHQYVSPRP